MLLDTYGDRGEAISIGLIDSIVAILTKNAQVGHKRSKATQNAKGTLNEAEWRPINNEQTSKDNGPIFGR